MLRSLRIMRLFGADIRIHWSLPLAVLLFVWLWNPATLRDLALALALLALLLASVLVHELGHSLAARAFGVATQAIMLWPLGGFAVLEKPPLRAWQDIIIIAAGPVANLGLAALAWLVLAAWNALPPAWSAGYNSGFGYVQLAGDALVFMNVALALFNLLPAYPLDGGQIVRRVLLGVIGEQSTARVLLWLSALLVLGMLLLSLLRADLLLAASALFIGLGTLTLSASVNERLITLFAKHDS